MKLITNWRRNTGCGRNHKFIPNDKILVIDISSENWASKGRIKTMLVANDGRARGFEHTRQKTFSVYGVKIGKKILPFRSHHLRLLA